jgi:hypothetical protein
VRTKFDKKKTEIRACPNEASCLPMVVFFAQNLKIGKLNNFKFGSNKTKGPKQDNQNQLRSYMPEGVEP